MKARVDGCEFTRILPPPKGSGFPPAKNKGIVFMKIICMWKIFEKAEVSGWFCIIPRLNVFKLFELSCGNGWKMFFLLIPVFGPIYYLIMLHKLSRAFGYGILLTILQIPAPALALFILAFGNNDYYGAY